jgi:hypothetical protein
LPYGLSFYSLIYYRIKYIPKLPFCQLKIKEIVGMGREIVPPPPQGCERLKELVLRPFCI